MTTTKHLHLDIETYSTVDIKTCGAYKYADDEAFEILLLAYAFGDDPIEVVDLAMGEAIPPKVVKAILQDDYIKLAHNANFERVCLCKHFNKLLAPSSWLCTSVRAASLGLPHSLEEVSRALGMDERKMSEGRSLINLFCRPNTKKDANGNKIEFRVYPKDKPELWKLFKKYNRQDVEVERAIYNRLESKPATLKIEQELYAVDQRMADEGVLVEMQIVNNILIYYDNYTSDLIAMAQRLTGIDNPRSTLQARQWLATQEVQAKKLDKEAVKNLLQDKELPPKVRRFLKIKQELGKTSIRKYDAMQRATCSDGRVHGMLQFMGAERTGRWAGRIVQLQNLPKNKLKDLDLARNIVLDNDFDLLEMLYKSPMNVCSQLIRTAFIAKPGYTLAVSDYSAIEARVIAWLAQETWRLEVFASHGKIYEASASQMFHVPLSKITKELRAKGKVAELALGFAGGVGALKAMGAEEMGLNDDEIKDIVASWRKASPNIVRFWKDVETAAKNALQHPGRTFKLRNLSFRKYEDSLFIMLPSGRELAYYRASLRNNPDHYGTEIIYFGKETGMNCYQTVRTYSGKLVENIVQATARDCLAWALHRLDKAELRPVFHVHDEVVIEVPEEYKDDYVDEIKEIMTLKEVPWIKGLRLTAAAYTTPYYLKD